MRRFHEEWHEAHWVSGRVDYAMAAGVPGPESLIHRPHQPRDQLVQLSLARAGIPHRVLVTLGLYERSEIKDALAHLTLLRNPGDAQGVSAGDSVAEAVVGSATAGLSATARLLTARARSTTTTS